MVEVLKPRAVVLFSGGLDSSTCLKIAAHQGFDCYALSIAYHQKNNAELIAAEKNAYLFGAKAHKTVSIDLMGLARSALIDPDLAIPDYQGNNEIPITYVPARNTIFLSLALGWAETLGAQDIFYGANAIDYPGYADCRPAFIQAFENLANLATTAGVQGQKFRIHAPLLNLTKAQIIQTGIALGIDYRNTISCYRADKEGRACGECDSCTFRKKGFAEAGIEDCTVYVD